MKKSVSAQLLRKRAKYLRQRATKSEILFVQRLIDRGIRHEFQRPVGPFIVDFLIPNKMLVIELDGEYHEWNKEFDEKRTKWLNYYGFTVIRIKNCDVGTFDLSQLRLYRDRPIKEYYRGIQLASKSRNKVKEKFDSPEDHYITESEENTYKVRRVSVSKFSVLPRIKTDLSEITVIKPTGERRKVKRI